MTDETGTIHYLNGSAAGFPPASPMDQSEPNDYPQEGRLRQGLEDWTLEQTKPVEDEPLSLSAQNLYKAALLIDGDRNNQHGDRHINFGTIATFWTVLFGVPVEPWKVARAFELAKIARDINGEPNEDNAIDAAAYSALSWELRG